MTGGAQLTYWAAVPALGISPPLSNAGVGGYLSYRLSNHVYADGAINAYFRQHVVRSAWDGGHMLQGLAGVKVGVRRESVGLFVKVRPGVTSSSAAFQGQDSRARTRQLGRSNAAAVDVGGIIEVNSGSRMVLRFEAGNVISFYRSRVVVLDGISTPQRAADSQESLQMSFGIGWRFH
ncbi:MAG TPA: hypothetical protein VJM31_06630 [Vicinamibacterales bacterium]|nr:hypothetical protein [Vicinamibacterales bacterium]